VKPKDNSQKIIHGDAEGRFVYSYFQENSKAEILFFDTP
jgi:hypothetical protein